MPARLALLLLLALPLAHAESRIDLADGAFVPPRAIASEWETVRWSWPEDETRSLVDDATGEVWCAASRGGCTHFFAKAGIYSYRVAGDPDLRGEIEVVRHASAESPLRASFRVRAQGLVATFDASAAASSRTAIVSYEWDFGDGSSYRCAPDGCVAEGSASEALAGGGRIVQHAYERPGSFVVRLTLADEEGASASNGRRIQLAFPGDPEAYFWTNVSVRAVQLDAAPREGSHRWDFGDGTSVHCERTCEASADTVATSATSLVHVYRRAGTFLVNHSTGPYWAASFVTVSQEEMFAASVDGLEVALDASALPRYGNATVRWLFGDLARAEGERARHTFPEPGLWSVEATLVDEVGEWSIERELLLARAVEAEAAAGPRIAAAARDEEPPRGTPAPPLVLVFVAFLAAAHASERYK